MFKVIIAGSREFCNYGLLKTKCDKILKQYHPNIEIVSGTARGADQLGERYAEERGYKLTRFPADWSKGKSAGYQRNIEMGDYAQALVAFWNGSKGTKHMIDIAESKSLETRIIKYR